MLAIVYYAYCFCWFYYFCDTLVAGGGGGAEGLTSWGSRVGYAGIWGRM